MEQEENAPWPSHEEASGPTPAARDTARGCPPAAPTLAPTAALRLIGEWPLRRRRPRHRLRGGQRLRAQLPAQRRCVGLSVRRNLSQRAGQGDGEVCSGGGRATVRRRFALGRPARLFQPQPGGIVLLCAFAFPALLFAVVSLILSSCFRQWPKHNKTGTPRRTF